MSHYMTGLAMKQRGLKPTTKIVLYWLADHFNDTTGACFPSISTLAAECEMDKATVLRHLKALEEMGLISREQRRRENGSQTSTSYTLSLKQPVAKCDSPCRKTQQAPVAKCDPHNLGSFNQGNEQEGSFEQKKTRTGGRDQEKPISAKSCSSVVKGRRSATPDEIQGMLEQVLIPEMAAAFIEHRKECKANLTPTAAKLLVNKLRKAKDPNAVVAQSIENGWKGVFPEKANFSQPKARYSNRPNANTIDSSRPSCMDPTVAYARRRYGG